MHFEMRNVWSAFYEDINGFICLKIIDLVSLASGPRQLDLYILHYFICYCTFVCKKNIIRFHKSDSFIYLINYQLTTLRPRSFPYSICFYFFYYLPCPLRKILIDFLQKVDGLICSNSQLSICLEWVRWKGYDKYSVGLRPERNLDQ